MGPFYDTHEIGPNRYCGGFVDLPRSPISVDPESALADRESSGFRLLNQSLTPLEARTEALARSIKKARFGAYRPGAYGTQSREPEEIAKRTECL